MICRKCGRENSDSSVLCSSCQTRLQQPTDTPILDELLTLQLLVSIVAFALFFMIIGVLLGGIRFWFVTFMTGLLVGFPFVTYFSYIAALRRRVTL